MSPDTSRVADLMIAVRILRQRGWIEDDHIAESLLCCPGNPTASEFLQVLIRSGVLSVSLANHVLKMTRDHLRTRLGDGRRRRSEDGSLGRLAIDRGWISADQLEFAVREQAKLRRIGLRFRIGEVLVRQGALTSPQVRWLLDLQGQLTRFCRQCGSVDLEPGSCQSCGEPLRPAPALGPVIADHELSDDLLTAT